MGELVALRLEQSGKFIIGIEFFHLMEINPTTPQNDQRLSPNLRYIVGFIAFTFFAKYLLQTLSGITYFAEMASTNLDVVIGYLHWYFLGVEFACFVFSILFRMGEVIKTQLNFLFHRFRFNRIFNFLPCWYGCFWFGFFTGFEFVSGYGVYVFWLSGYCNFSGDFFG